MKNNLQDDDVKLKVLSLKGKMKYEEIGQLVGVDRRRISEFLRKVSYNDWWNSMSEASVDTVPSMSLPKKTESEVFKIVTTTLAKNKSKHLFISDLQIKPNLDTGWLVHIGKLIVEEKPDVIINIGDHFDLPSLSSYDKGTKKAEGRHLSDDITSGIEGMKRLLQPLYDYQQQELAEYGEVRYTPKMVFCMGNHEQRLMRHINANPELTDLVSYSDLKLEEFGWEVYDFLEPAVVNGVLYIHYIPNPMTGKPYGGSALNILQKIGCSASMGHVQKLDIANRTTLAGKQQWLLVCGAGYPHKEGYKGHTGNNHFRGVVLKHNVSAGEYSPRPISLKELEETYGTN